MLFYNLVFTKVVNTTVWYLLIRFIIKERFIIKTCKCDQQHKHLFRNVTHPEIVHGMNQILNVDKHLLVKRNNCEIPIMA